MPVCSLWTGTRAAFARLKIATRQDPDGVEDGNVGTRVGSSEARVTYSFDDFVARYPR
jgi:hypothetical protein